VRIGGDRFDEAIIAYVRRSHGMLIGESSAERIKLEIGCAYQQDKVREVEVSGRHLAEGVPKMTKINSNEVLEALREPLAGIISSIRQALEQTPPELCADVAERGIVLTGGGAMLRDLDRLISEQTGLHVQIADDPLTCVARGGGRALELLDMHGNEFFAPE
jgi:rod shape-determining protein MreB